MKTILKIVFWTFVAIITAVTASVVAAFVFREDLIAYASETVNSRISTKTYVGEYKFSLLKRFPRASVELKDVTVLSSAGVDKSQFPGLSTDTLLQARSVTLEFRLADLARGAYSIENATVSNGNLLLLTDSSGGINYFISTGAGETAADRSLDLKRIDIRNIKTGYYNNATKLHLAGIVGHARLRSSIKGSLIDLDCSAELTLNRFDLHETRINASTAIVLDINMRRSDTSVVFRKGFLKLEGFTFDLSGFIHPRKEILLKVTGTNIDLSRAGKYMPHLFRDKLKDYQAGGILNGELILYGPLDRTRNLNADARFSVTGGSLSRSKPELKLRNIGFSGTYTNGEKALPSTSRLQLDNCSLNIGNALWSSSFSLTNFTDPVAGLVFSGDIFPSELIGFFKIPGVLSADGSARLNLKISGHVFKNGRLNMGMILSAIQAADIRFESLSVKHSDERVTFSNATGNVMISENIWADNLAFTQRDSRFLVSGAFGTLPAWLAGKQTPLKINAEIAASGLNPEFFIQNTGKTGKPARAFKLPDGIDADLTVRLDDFSYKKFRAEKISGRIMYKPGNLNVTDLNALTLGGQVSGNFLLAASPSNTFVSQGGFQIESVDIRECFTSFGNFGQNFIHASNLAGTLTGSLRLLMPLDSTMRPVVKAINAEGRYKIENGALTGFEPVKALSNFIDLRELEDIRFSKIENDLFIRNNALSIPQMEIFSSAADFTVSGKHTFENRYEYHIKVYLSELLTGKYKRNRKLSTEFGAIEDDGLGRTSVYLSITGKDDNLKVAYDLKAAGSNIRESMRNERSNLRNILNEEYGWFRKDSQPVKVTEPAPRFKIEWSESADSTDTRVVEPEPPGENLINRLLRRKKNINP